MVMDRGSGDVSTRRTLRLVALVAIAVLVAATSCSPPALVATSPFSGFATRGIDGSYEGNVLACASGGGRVTAAVVNSGFTETDPYVVEIFSGWDATPSHLVASGLLATGLEPPVSSPSLPLGACFRVRIRQLRDRSSFFTYRVTWCTGSCTSTPVAPRIRSFATTGGPHRAPALVPFTWEVDDRNPDDVLACRLDVDGDGTWEVTVDDCADLPGHNASAGAGDHVAVLEVSDGSLPPVTRTTAYTVAPGPAEPYDITVRQTVPLAPPVQAALDESVARWEAVLARGVEDNNASIPASQCGTGGQPFDGTIDDMLVDVVVGPIDGRGGIGGTAGSCLDGPDGLPHLGLIIIDSEDVDSMLARGVLGSVIAHEFGHVFGMPGTRFAGLLTGADSDDPRFVGPRAILEWQKLGGDPRVPGVPVHPHNIQHWRGGDIAGELMDDSGLRSDSRLSRLTVATFADLGYLVDITAADPFELPQ